MTACHRRSLSRRLYDTLYFDTAAGRRADYPMIRAGLGIALLPRNAVTLFRDPQIVFRRIDDLDLWRSLYLLQPAQGLLSDAARAFIDLL